jgi:hypothetical protein
MLLTKLAAAKSGLSTGMVLDRGGPAFERFRRTSLRRWPPTHWTGQGGVLFLAPGIVNVGEPRIGRRDALLRLLRLPLLRLRRDGVSPDAIC